ncbi:hypothetical protein CCAX7_18410 [Capsulimonas corticalis]|uniref:Uncharacterized protein n=1 Tax=Capsulimonas corticalis TaxID=2219043 RepID=A0A402D5I5_9BACT|nr:hypothetical protein [Capsulimonas corticalis]BDI29790.1 hypothetical protein CCAX7_18410 [Capsulimonas corticalis]
MKLVCSRIACIAALLFSLAFAASAKPPTLSSANTPPIPAEVQQGRTYVANLTYIQSEGDAPTTLKMVLETPGGEVIVPAAIPSGDATAGIPVTWSYTPANSGTYHYHFEAVSSTGGSVRFPATVNNDFEFVSSNPITKWIIFLVGTAIALIFLPFVVYVGARAANKRGDPAAASRVALLVGVLASYALFFYLFFANYGPLMMVLGGIVALAILIVLFTRK